MLEFDGQTFLGPSQSPSFKDISARNCTFNGCHLPRSSSAGRWNTITNVRLENAAQINCSADTTSFEDVTLHNLKRQGASPLFLWSCVFRHTKISGRVSGIKINRSVGVGPDRTLQPDWDQAVLAYYREVDWALDISEAKFQGGVTFEAIPGHLIRRNPETQILVTRDRLATTDWRSLDYDGTAIDYALSWFLDGSLFDSCVIASRADSKWVKRDTAVLQRLRAVGLAEPD